jgi:SAM-dependent methyltransferase
VFLHTLPILAEAEKLASTGTGIEPIVEKLRQLSLDDFGEFFIGLPNPVYPALSRVLPPMASAEVQRNWTGSSGIQLLTQTTSFVRQLENNYTRYLGKPLANARIMDFGCGYGRIFRMMYYYAYPKDLWGVDAWQRSLDICKQDRLPGNFALSERIPDSLPVGGRKFDLIFSFSVFTHLAPKAAAACLAALRRHIDDKGLLVATIRPIEFWPYIEKAQGMKVADAMRLEHMSKGFAYHPHGGMEGETYGDSSIAFDFFTRSGWKMVGYDRSMVDPYQVSVILRPS